MASKKLSFAIIGTGVDGLTVAATLCRAGFNVQVYEQLPVLKGGDGDTSWLNGYDGGNVPLASMEPEIRTV